MGGQRAICRVIGALALALTLLAGPWPAGARAATMPPVYADPAFRPVWERYDRPVLYGTAARSWTWAGNLTGALREPFREGPDGTHLVQYFEKSRMEINDPKGDPSSPFFVTQGLLASDMIRGRVQIGVDDFEPRQPANVPFGDLDDETGPTYASFTRLLGAPPKPAGAPITESLDRAGRVGTVADSGGVTSAGEVPGSGHSIAAPFWDYLRQSGQVYEDARDRVETLYDPTFYVTGLPVTEAYWTRLKAAGALRSVLIQCFERRCLTYTPANAPAWRVEQGNTGLQYHRWRYETAPPPVQPSGDPIAFTSLRDGLPQTWLMEPDGSGQRRLTAGEGEEVDPAWSPDRAKFAFSHEGFIFTVNADGSGLTRLEPAGRYQSGGDYQPAWSPDGRQIAFMRCRDYNCNSDIWIMNADGSGARRLIADASEPAWSPDGKRLVYASSLMVGTEARGLSVANADGSGVTPLTAAGPGYMPAWSPDGTALAFTSRRDGRFGIYTARPDGSGARRLPGGAAGDDYAPSWSPDSKRIAFASTRDRSYTEPGAVAIYVMNEDGGGQTRLTDPAERNSTPAWGR